MKFELLPQHKDAISSASDLGEPPQQPAALIFTCSPTLIQAFFHLGPRGNETNSFAPGRVGTHLQPTAFVFASSPTLL